MASLEAFNEEYYQQAIEELESGMFSEALWSKALAKADFDKTKAKGKYVDLRVQQLAEAVKAEEELQATEAHHDLLQQENAQLDSEVASLKTEYSSMVISNSLGFGIQVLAIAVSVGIMLPDWWWGLVAAFALYAMTMIPFIRLVPFFVMPVAFAYVAYEIGGGFSPTAANWSAGLVLLALFGVNHEIYNKLKDIERM
ncbi:MAG: hypothetical protein HWE20_09750 [Gammaproteobacteria bacterium]|nr:hypothetical protein [Gammaproteobacteria bacterium]